MDVADAVVVVTGGGRGIGQGLCEAFAEAGAAAVVVADLDGDAAEQVAASIGGTAVQVDAADEADVIRLLTLTESEFGVPDLFCANAGVGVGGDLDASDAAWERAWRVNTMSHVYAARQCVPRMLARGGGYLLHTASAAGLLSMAGAAPYAVSKHAAVAVAEYTAMTYRSRGIRVSCLCPQAVDTRLLHQMTDPDLAASLMDRSEVLDPAKVAAAVLAGLAEERFLILPHPEVAEYYRRRATDPDRWLAGMSRVADALSRG